MATMVPASTPTADQEKLVKEWLVEEGEASSDLPGVESIEETSEGVKIQFKEELDLSLFAECIEGHELDDPRFDQIHLEVRSLEESDGVQVYEIKDLGNGSQGSFKVGSTYYPTKTVVLSGNGEPMWPEGEPVDSVVEHTLLHLSLYIRGIEKW